MKQVLRENVHTVLYLAGFALVCRGVAGWSVPAAELVAGVVLMAMGAWPYLRRTRER